MASLKSLFRYKQKPNKVSDFKLAQIWWWRHNAQCGKIIIQPEPIVNDDSMSVAFVNEAGGKWTYRLKVVSNELIAFEIDYTSIVNADNVVFEGKVVKIQIQWKLYQQMFLVQSNSLIIPEEDFWIFDI